MNPGEPHDEFLKLCAVSTAGELTPLDARRLQEHLAVCSACREALRQYDILARQAIPDRGAEELESVTPGPGWSPSQAEARLFTQLRQEGSGPREVERENGRPAIATRAAGSHLSAALHASTWRNIWMLSAAAILLMVTLGLAAYWIGIHRGTTVTATPSRPEPTTTAESSFPNLASLEEQLSDAAHERELARAQIAERDRTIAELRHRLEAQNVRLLAMQQKQETLSAQIRSGEAGRQQLLGQQAELTKKLDAAHSESLSLSQKLDAATRMSAQESAIAKALEDRVGELTHRLEEREAAFGQQEQLLAHDRDIRELMGARDLYIAEVYDVADNGATKKPYGRVFYTKGKSLIFYAYDLDQPPWMKATKSFQAWGRRGPDRQQALSLGVFYQDNAAKKRWVLKLDNPKVLAQIDAVFVTVEPNGGSHKPSGQSLLFAYLGVEANHP